jgi:hypothetical protein
MAFAILIAASSWEYQLALLLPWLGSACLAVFFVAAGLHWLRTRHWCLLALAVCSLLVSVGALASKLAMMFPDHPRETLPSGTVHIYLNAALHEISIWLNVFGMVAGIVGGIGAILLAIRLRRPN